MKNIVVATKENIGYYPVLVESCKRNNIDLIVMGLHQKWTGFTMRFRLWLEYLKTLNDTEIVMITDAYDVVIIRDSSVIIDRFLKFKKKIVFGVENGIMSRMIWDSCIDNYNINMGNFIGYVKYLKKFIRLIYKYQSKWEQYEHDDQMIVNRICKLESNFF
jgi:hypothetical protein